MAAARAWKGHGVNRLPTGPWAVLLFLLSAAAAGFAIVDVVSPLRVLFVLVFLLFVPGSAIVRLFGFDELAVQLALGMGLSVSLGGIVAGILLYTGAWSPGATLAILIGVTFTAVAVELERTSGRSSPGSAARWTVGTRRSNR
jgi:hypothetical protein